MEETEDQQQHAANGGHHLAWCQLLEVQNPPSFSSSVPRSRGTRRLAHHGGSPIARTLAEGQPEPATPRLPSVCEADRGARERQRDHSARHARRRAPDHGGARRPTVRRGRHRRERRRAGRNHRPGLVRSRFRPGCLHPRGGRRARPSRDRSDRDGRFRHHPREADPRRLSRSHRQHAPRAAPRVQGLARGRRCGRRGREGHRLHRAHRAPRGRRRPDPRAGGGAGLRRRHRRDAARAHQRSRAPHLPAGAAHVGGRDEV